MGEILILFIYKRQKKNDNNNNNKIKKIKKSNQIRMVIKGVIAHQFKAYSPLKSFGCCCRSLERGHRKRVSLVLVFVRSFYVLSIVVCLFFPGLCVLLVLCLSTEVVKTGDI
jgi:hypothetical protein